MNRRGFLLGIAAVPIPPCVVAAGQSPFDVAIHQGGTITSGRTYVTGEKGAEFILTKSRLNSLIDRKIDRDLDRLFSGVAV